MPALANAADILRTTVAEADAGKRWLTTRDSVKTALRIATAASDGLIDVLIPRASALIAAACGLARDVQASIASFALETFEATWLDGCRPRGDELCLPWRVPVTEISSVTEDGIALVADTDYRLTAAIPGRLLRLSDGVPICWSWAEIVVTFKAGLSLPANVPLDLEAACIDQVKAMLMGSERDPAIRSESAPDIASVSYALPGGDTFKGVLLPQVEAAIAPWANPLP